MAKCSVSWCGNSSKARGMCPAHYERDKRGVDMDRPIRPRSTNYPATCTHPGCARPHKSRGLCSYHYKLEHADIRHGLTRAEREEIFQAQGERCAACGDPLSRGVNGGPGGHIDHDHEHCPGVQGCKRCVRGIICPHCNAALGYIRDSVDRARSLIDYLEGKQIERR
jgi:hypothetical protein